MSESTQFLELSALLTGLSEELLHDPEERALNAMIAAEYARRLHGTFGEKFVALTKAYDEVRAANPTAPIDDALLAKLRAKPEFAANEIVAKQIVGVWFLSQFQDETGEMIDGGFYERGAVWRFIKAHPIGFSDLPYGYWARMPRTENGEST